MSPDPESRLAEAEVLVQAGDLRGILAVLGRFSRELRDWIGENGFRDHVDAATGGSYLHPEARERVRAWNLRLATVVEAVEAERTRTLDELEAVRRGRRFQPRDERTGRWVEDRA